MTEIGPCYWASCVADLSNIFRGWSISRIYLFQCWMMTNLGHLLNSQVNHEIILVIPGWRNLPWILIPIQWWKTCYPVLLLNRCDAKYIPHRTDLIFYVNYVPYLAIPRAVTHWSRSPQIGRIPSTYVSLSVTHGCQRCKMLTSQTNLETIPRVFDTPRGRWRLPTFFRWDYTTYARNRHQFQCTMIAPLVMIRPFLFFWFSKRIEWIESNTVSGWMMITSLP